MKKNCRGFIPIFLCILLVLSFPGFTSNVSAQEQEYFTNFDDGVEGNDYSGTYVDTDNMSGLAYSRFEVNISPYCEDFCVLDYFSDGWINHTYSATANMSSWYSLIRWNFDGGGYGDVFEYYFKNSAGETIIGMRMQEASTKVQFHYLDVYGNWQPIFLLYGPSPYEAVNFGWEFIDDETVRYHTGRYSPDPDITVDGSFYGLYRYTDHGVRDCYVNFTDGASTNAEFVFDNVTFTTGSGMSYGSFFVDVEPVKDPYNFGEFIQVKTSIPSSYDGVFYLYCRDGVETSDDKVFIYEIDDYDRYTHKGYDSFFMRIPYGYMSKVYDSGTWTFYLDNHDVINGSYYYRTTKTINVSGWYSDVVIQPYRDLFYEGEKIKYYLFGSNSTFYNVSIVYANDTVLSSHNGVKTNSYGFYDGFFDDIEVGFYKLKVYLGSDSSYKNQSSVFSVSSEQYLNRYSIYTDRDSYVQNSSIDIRFSRTGGDEDYYVAIRYEGSGPFMIRQVSVDNFNYEWTHDIDDFSLGRYVLYMYDYGGSVEDPNAVFKIITITAEDDSSGGFVVEGEDYTLLFGFVISLIFGILGFIVTDSGLGFGSTFLGSVVLMSVPGHPLSFFPPIVLFIIGFSMILIFIAMIRS